MCDPDLLHGARVGDDLVLLDLESGDYSLAPGLFARGALALAARLELVRTLAGRPAPPRLLAVLDDAGPAPALIRSPARALPEAPVEPTLKDRRAFAVAWLCLGQTYARRPFRRLLAPPAVRGAAVDEGELMRLCGSFERLLPLAPFPGLCLYRAFFLRAFLARAGCSATWVFGVRTWPFRAHCWLQRGNLVLNDDPLRVALYVPILAI